ncbi:protein PHTF2-like [Mercenaria mercenaria]|uniref:protein PHTF2-like n=1 Tax=Mercenaria mercenaria TaxID=6596 RepID=UPI00234F8B40|nr:protein PHTF2-like [Mercenaria mercenaria]
MDRVQTTVAWYQQKIGSYDKQLWEQSVEQKVIEGIQQAPRRVVRPKTELIDVDLVRGSTFTKAKPQVPWTYITIKTFSRVVLFPFHYQWWIQQTSLPFWMFLMVLYTMQIITTCVFFNNVGEELTQEEQSLSEVVIPFILMVFLGLIHSQTILTHLKPPVRDNKRDGWRRKRSLSQNRGSVSNIDVIGSASTAQCDPSPNQSKSSMKGHKGSRPLRERTKERRVRLKPNNQRPSLRREHSHEKCSQDSESAYHTHEASDSIADRTSSVEHDSNGCGKRDNLVDNKLDISPRITVSCSSEATKKVQAFLKKNESQESDFPKDSNSDDDKLAVIDDGCEKSKRHSQSISSDNDDDDVLKVNTSPVTVNATSVGAETFVGIKSEDKKILDTGNTDLSKKIQFEGESHVESNKVMPNQDSSVIQCSGEASTKEVINDNHRKTDENSSSGKVVLKKQPHTEDSDGSFLNISLENSPEKESRNGACDTNNETKELSSQKRALKSTCPTSLKLESHTDYMSKSSEFTKDAQNSTTHSVSSVHFTKDLVQLREITPKSSREGTPTHTQSDVLLQTKRALRGSGMCPNSDTESESDNNLASTKLLPNVRRRKMNLPDSTEISGNILRNRRQASLTLRDAKTHSTHSTTGVSSSEGETEGTEYSRGSRRNMASSEEWGDHLQSDVNSTTESSSCGTEPEIAENEEPDQESENEAQSVQSGQNVGITTSNLHAMNILTSSTSSSTYPPDKVTCIIWERNECKKVELTALDIGWAIIETVHKIPESSDYIFIGLTFSLLMSATPFLFEAFHSKDLPALLSWDILSVIWEWSGKNTWRSRLIHTNAALQRFALSAIFFFLLSVADRTFKQRLLYAKHFCYLTSSRRARKFDLPHLRLNKVRNIRTWLSLRSYLKKRGPQRSVDVIVSSAFLLTLIMLILMCLQLLREAETYLNYLVNWELLLWCMALGVYLLRFMTLGLRINKKYRNLSVLITEQINLYLQMEQKPHKKEELMVANNVLKLAESLLKELESPFKISGISANPLILNVTKVVVLSAFSAVLTELLGFKLKLYKIKLRA